MKNKENLIFYFKTAAVLTIIASLTALMLAFVNALTADRIAENMKIKTNEAITNLFAEGKTFEKIEVEYKLPVTDIWSVNGEDGRNIGYCVFVTVIGFKEKIEIVVGADPAGKCVGIKILTSSETAGLGSLINEPDYMSQYIGKTKGMELNNEIDVISGATISSRAVLDGVNAALAVNIFDQVSETAMNETENNVEDDGTEGVVSDGQDAE